MNVWDFFKNFFQEAEQSSSSKPLIREVISRDEKEMAAFNGWKNSLEQRRLMDWLTDQFAIWKVLPDDIHKAILFLDTPSSKGFAVRFRDLEKKQNPIFFFDFLKEKTQALNYRIQIADTRTWSSGNEVHTMERYYLKPRTSKMPDGKINQLFGNIMIELLHKDNIPFNLKFRATSYNDRLYHPAPDFRQLMNELLQ